MSVVDDTESNAGFEYGTIEGDMTCCAILLFVLYHVSVHRT